MYPRWLTLDISLVKYSRFEHLLNHVWASTDNSMLQAVNLLPDLRDEMGVALLFLSHDIGLVAHISDRRRVSRPFVEP